MHGQRKSQLHVSKYWPETCHPELHTLTSPGHLVDPCSCEDAPGLSRVVYIVTPRSNRYSSGLTATSTPRTTSAIPAVRAITAPPGASFSAATSAAISSTQWSPMAPAATRTTVSAQQQPMQ